MLKPTGRIVNVASMAGKLNKYSEEVRNRFLASKTEEDVTAIMKDFAAAVDAGKEKEKGFISAAYAVSKAGLIGATRALARSAKEGGKEGVLVNACCPGYVNTDMTKGNGTVSFAPRHIFCRTYGLTFEGRKLRMKVRRRQFCLRCRIFRGRRGHFGRVRRRLIGRVDCVLHVRMESEMQIGVDSLYSPPHKKNFSPITTVKLVTTNTRKFMFASFPITKSTFTVNTVTSRPQSTPSNPTTYTYSIPRSPKPLHRPTPINTPDYLLKTAPRVLQDTQGPPYTAALVSAAVPQPSPSH